MDGTSNFHSMVNDFTAHIQAERSLSPATIADYTLQLQAVRKYANERSLTANVHTWPRMIFQDCLAWLNEHQKISFASLGRKRKAFAEFARFLTRVQTTSFDHVAVSAMPLARLSPVPPVDGSQVGLRAHAPDSAINARGRFKFDINELSKGLAEFRTMEAKYLVFMKYERGASSNTVRLHKYALRSLLHFLKAENLDITPRSFDKGLFFEFLSSQEGRKLSASTNAQLFTALRGYFRYLHQTNYLQTNPFEFVKTPKLKRGLPRPLTLVELDKLASVFDQDVHQERRDLLLVELLVGSGLRISEGLTLKVKDLLLEGGPLGAELTATGKGQKQRKVPMSDTSVNLARKWISDLRLQRDDFLFPSPKRRTPYFRQTSFERRFKMYLVRAGLDRAITPHCLRHSFATLLADENVDIRAIQEMLGHASLSTTQIYTKVSSPRMHMYHRKCHPRNFEKGSGREDSSRITGANG